MTVAKSLELTVSAWKGAGSRASSVRWIFEMTKLLDGSDMVAVNWNNAASYSTTTLALWRAVQAKRDERLGGIQQGKWKTAKIATR